MSEFSASYHLRCDDQEEAVKLVRACGLKGYVFEASNNWVTFVLDEESGPNSEVYPRAKQPLVHYINAEDHVWGFCLYIDGELVSSYNISYDMLEFAEELPDGVDAINDSGYSRADILKINPEASATLDLLEPLLRPDDPMEIFEADPRPCDLFAKALNLSNYDWISYNYVKSAEDKQGVIHVE